jgi:hypothetical protein
MTLAPTAIAMMHVVIVVLSQLRGGGGAGGGHEGQRGEAPAGGARAQGSRQRVGRGGLQPWEPQRKGTTRVGGARARAGPPRALPCTRSPSRRGVDAEDARERERLVTRLGGADDTEQHTRGVHAHREEHDPGDEAQQPPRALPAGAGGWGAGARVGRAQSGPAWRVAGGRAPRPRGLAPPPHHLLSAGGWPSSAE